MFLDRHIDKNIIVKINTLGATDKTVKMFFETGSLIQNKLLGVDEVGIWLEGFITATINRDDDNNELPEPIEKEVTTSVLIRWDYIECLFLVNEQNANKNSIGFKRAE